MATPEIMAKKAARQTAEILAAVQSLAAEVAELKAAQPGVIELTAEIDEKADWTDEILAANQKLVMAVGSMADELVRLKAEIAELKALIEPAQKMPAQMPTRARHKPKK